MVNGLYSSLDGIQSSINRQDEIAHNIANVNTKRYDFTSVDSMREPDYTRVSEVDLAKETVDSITNLRYLQANIQVARTYNEMLGSIIDLRV